MNQYEVITDRHGTGDDKSIIEVSKSVVCMDFDQAYLYAKKTMTDDEELKHIICRAVGVAVIRKPEDL